ncbi:CD1845 family protein [Bengtsoniella intestinalis]|uniref:CD1845 family protein n=1 Tax=Bengtsoniella intestinalis TaxID=3073143 RepID=UPI00391EE79D
MKCLLKIVLFPITFALSLVLSIAKFLLIFGGGLLGLVASLGFLVGLFLLITHEVTGGVLFLVLSYLISPYGLPLLGAWIIAQVEGFNDWLRAV